MRRSGIFLILVVFTGCIPTSTQHGSDLSKLETFTIERNKTTEKELVDHFGPPMNTTIRGDGSRMLLWNDTRAQGHVNMARYLPFVNLAAGNAGEQNVTHRTLTATVQNGVVVDYTVSDGNNKQVFN